MHIFPPRERNVSVLVGFRHWFPPSPSALHAAALLHPFLALRRSPGLPFFTVLGDRDWFSARKEPRSLPFSRLLFFLIVDRARPPHFPWQAGVRVFPIRRIGLFFPLERSGGTPSIPFFLLSFIRTMSFRRLSPRPFRGPHTFFRIAG